MTRDEYRLKEEVDKLKHNIKCHIEYESGLFEKISELKKTIVDRESVAFNCAMGAENTKVEMRKLEKEIAELKNDLNFSNHGWKHTNAENIDYAKENEKLKDEVRFLRGIKRNPEQDKIIKAQAEIIRNLRVLARVMKAV